MVKLQLYWSVQSDPCTIIIIFIDTERSVASKEISNVLVLQILIVVSNYFIYNYRHILISNRFADPVLLRIFRTIILILHISPSQENEGNNGTRRRLGQSVHQISLRYPNLLQPSVVRR